MRHSAEQVAKLLILNIRIYEKEKQENSNHATDENFKRSYQPIMRTRIGPNTFKTIAGRNFIPPEFLREIMNELMELNWNMVHLQTGEYLLVSLDNAHNCVKLGAKRVRMLENASDRAIDESYAAYCPSFNTEPATDAAEE